MHLSEGFWTVVTYVSSWLVFSPVHSDQPQQNVIGSITEDHQTTNLIAPPIFKPPGGRVEGPGDEFLCTYPLMKGWSSCSETNSSCWLKKDDGTDIFDTGTDYELRWPNGTDRYYNLQVYDGWINADGINASYSKLFNSTNPGPLFDSSFPGPWIQACWGDTVHVNVTNYLSNNGTSIHWHGIRQLNTMHMDGVNGVTQCPIAPGDSFVYTFKVTQYGSSWYHSHYSVQYADGLQGPITLHGPSTAQYNESKLPLIITDWGHNSAFNSVYTQNMDSPSILLNGRGNVTKFDDTPNQLPVPDPLQWTFEAVAGNPMRYLLRIINTSFGTSFIFSIDNHWLEVVEADFVPIVPYTTKSIMVSIGQRYDVIVEAAPDGSNVPDDLNFWIRTYIAQGCTEMFNLKSSANYSETGILRYNANSSATPTSQSWPDLPLDCLDPSYVESYKPKVPWTVGASANGAAGQELGVVFDGHDLPFPLARFSFQAFREPVFTPLRIDYEDPMFFHLNDNTQSFPQNWVVVSENYTDQDWVFLVLENNMGFANHPIHLHGHDFAIVQYNYTDRWYPELFKYNNYDNPPRRDVVLLPKQGYVVIAFKTDNPGNWLMHCHIAYHASMGLGLQILERQSDANKTWPHGNSPALTEAERVCKNWSFFFNDCRNWAPGLGISPSTGTLQYQGCEVYGVNKESFQDDSGI